MRFVKPVMDNGDLGIPGVVLLAASPVPLLLAPLIFLHCFIRFNRASARSLQRQNRVMGWTASASLGGGWRWTGPQREGCCERLRRLFPPHEGRPARAGVLGGLRLRPDRQLHVVGDVRRAGRGEGLGLRRQRPQPYRFSSEYADDVLGLAYYNYRHYEPTTGRWTQRDPIGAVGGWNVYSYVVNRPMSIVDLLGLSCCPGDKRIVAIIYEDACSISKGNPDFENLRALLGNLEVLNYIQLGSAGATVFLDGLMAGVGKGVSSAVVSGADFIAGDLSTPDGSGAVAGIERLYEKLKTNFQKLRGKLYYQECAKWMLFGTHWVDKVLGPSAYVDIDILGIDQANPVKAYDVAQELIDKELFSMLKEMLDGGRR